MAFCLLYTGSFDPLTNGHLDVIGRGLAIADRLVVAVGVHASKAPLFATAERIAMIEEAAGPLAAQAGRIFEVATYDDLSIGAARRFGAHAIIRGIRDSTDLDYEMQMASMNETMAPTIRTIFVPASPSVRMITATLVRQIAAMGGDVAPFVPDPVMRRLAARKGASDPVEA